MLPARRSDSVPLLLLLLLSLLSAGGRGEPELDDGGEDDWTAGCPKTCRCKWVSGKRTAECQAAGFRYLPDFGQPDKIQVLHMSGNKLRALPERVFQRKGLLNVQKAYLQNCSLAEVHATAFEGLEILIELDLSDNLMRTLQPGTFKGNNRIRKLWLGRNPVRSLAGFSFPRIEHLKMLDLSRCLLTKLARPNFALLENLEVLQVNDNRFRRLDKRAFFPLRRLKSLTLEGNPWQCDCRLQDFWRWLMTNNLFSLPTACAMPEKLEGVTWDKLTDAALACPPEVYAPEPMVTVSSGDKVTLSCLVSTAGNPDTELRWVRGGVAIANNSRSDDGGDSQYYTITVGGAFSGRASAPLGHDGQRPASRGAGKIVVSSIDGSVPRAHHVPSRPAFERGTRRRWFNLTIENVHPSGSGGYSCAARNEGGSAHGNVTVVYSESVATYLDKSEISTLLVVGAAAGSFVFVLISIFLVCLVARRKARGPQTSTTTRVPAGAEEHQLVVQSSASGYRETSLSNGRKVATAKPASDGGKKCAKQTAAAAETRLDPLSPINEGGEEEPEVAFGCGQGASEDCRQQIRPPQVGPASKMLAFKARPQLMDSSFDSTKTLDSGLGCSLAANSGGGGNSSGSSSNGSSNILLQSSDKSQKDGLVQAVGVPSSNGLSPSGCTSSSFDSLSNGGNNSQANSASTDHNQHSTATAPSASSSVASSSTTLKSSTFGLPPTHSIMDRMWRRDLGSNTHLLSSSNNSCESLPYNNGHLVWASPMHAASRNYHPHPAGASPFHHHQQHRGDLYQQHDLTLPRRHDGGQMQGQVAMGAVRHSHGVGFAAAADSLLDREDSGRILRLQQMQSHRYPLSSSSARPQPPPFTDVISPTEHLRKTNPSSSSSSHPSQGGDSSSREEGSPFPPGRTSLNGHLASFPSPSKQSHHQYSQHQPHRGGGGDGGQHPATTTAFHRPPPALQYQHGHQRRHQQPSSISLSADAADPSSNPAKTDLLKQELEARKELLEALVKDKNDTAV